MSALTTYDSDNSGYDGAVLAATNGGTIELSSQLTSLAAVLLTLDGTGTIPIGQFTSITDGGIKVEGGDYATGSPLAKLADIDGSSLYASGGGSLALPGVSSYQNTGNTTTFQAYAQSSTYPYTDTVGTISLANLASITGSVNIIAQGEGSEIDLPLVPSLGGGSLSVTQDATVQAPLLTALTGVGVTLDGTGTIATSQWQSLTHGSLTITAGDYSSTSSPPFADLKDITDSSLYVYGGGSLTLAGVTSYTGYYNNFQPEESSYYSESAGTISLPNLATIGGYVVSLVAYGQGSELDLPALTSFSASYSSLSVTNQGTIQDGELTALSGIGVTLDGTGTIATSQWQSLTSGSLTITAGDYSSTSSPPFVALSNINDSSLYAYGGGSLALPAVTSYKSNYNTFQPEQATYYSGSVGTISLPALTTIGGNNLSVVAYGSGSLLAMPALLSWNAPGSALSVTNDGTVQDNNLATLVSTTVTLDGTGIVPTAPWTSVTGSNLVITGGQYTFNLLRDLQGSSIEVSNGANVTLTALTTYTNPNGGTTYLKASGASSSGTPSTLTLSELATIGADNGYLELQALGGGQLNLPLLATITDASPDVQVTSQGTGSQVSLPSLAEFSGQNGNASLTVTQGGSLNAPRLNDFVDVSVTTDPTATYTLTPIETFAITDGATITMTTATLIEQGSLSIPDNATVNAKGSLEVNGSGVLQMTPAATLNVSGDLLGNTTDADLFTLMGTVAFVGAAGTGSPQHLEAMSADMGAVQSGFNDNFAYGTIDVIKNTYLQLVRPGPQLHGQGSRGGVRQ